MKPSVLRIVVKDLIDFLIIFSVSFGMTLGIYYLLPSFTPVVLSWYFFEQFIELFFVNPKLLLWLLCLSLGVTTIYFMLCSIIHQTTIGGLVTGMTMVHQKSHAPVKLHHSMLMAIGAYAGVLAILLGPLSSWWLDREHRGWSEKLARTVFVKKGASSQKSA